MIRISTLGSAKAAAAYYSAPDSNYYLDGQDREPPATWHGKLAAELGLSGEVGRDDFHALCHNRHPVTGEPLTAARRADRDVGRDLTLSVPKSVTLAGVLGGDERILPEIVATANDVMQQLEQRVGTRVRKGEQDGERCTGNACWTLFPHLTTRPIDGEPDPQYHLHAVLFSLTRDPVENQLKSIHFKEIVRDAPLYEAMFRANLAKRLQTLGYQIERKGKDFELAGFDADVLKCFSRRTAEVEAAAKRLGLKTPQAKAKLGATTRQAKSQSSASWSQLLRGWQQRLSPGKLHELLQVAQEARTGGAVRATPAATPDAALDFALAHLLERASAATQEQVLTEALRHGLGSIGVEETQQALAGRTLIRQQIDGRQWLTTHEVLAEERRLIDFAIQGRGKHPPLRLPKTIAEGDLAGLDDDQRRAVRHVWTSPDALVLVKGMAGVGKTTLTRAALGKLDVPWVVHAPSSEASRGVLRREGFAQADTLQKFMQDQAMQESVRGGLIWVDEASLCGAATLARLVAVAKGKNARIVLAGDPQQHRSIERGTILELLQKHARLPAAEVTTIKRQAAGRYRDAVRLLAEGKTDAGLDVLTSLGWVQRLPAPGDYAPVVREYLRALDENASVLVVAPTHAEGQLLTDQLRRALRKEGRIGAEDRTFEQLWPLSLTQAQKADPANLTGTVLQFHRNAGEFRAGQRVEATPEVAQRAALRPAAFSAYQRRNFQLAEGDAVRIGNNGFSKDGKHRLNNGAFYRIAAFTPSGDLELDNEWVVGRDFGHLAHGLVSTSHASQGRTTDRVLVVQTEASLPASSREQFYVSVSRARQSAKIFCTDEDALRQAVRREDRRPSASDLLGASPSWRRKTGLRARLARHLETLRAWPSRLAGTELAQTHRHRSPTHERPVASEGVDQSHQTPSRLHASGRPVAS